MTARFFAPFQTDSHTTFTLLPLALACSVACCFACGDEGSSSAVGQGGTVGAGGNSTSGSRASGGGSAEKGGSSGSGGATLDPLSTAGHCGPQNAGLDLDKNCINYDTNQSGIAPGSQLWVVSNVPLGSIVAGKRYAVSVGIAKGPTTFEFWGAISSCGAAIQKLAEVRDAPVGVHCQTFTANQDFDYVLMATRGSGGFMGLHLCDDGTCP